MIPPPHTLVAELTHACPLRCAYCSNPVRPARARASTSAWLQLLDESAALGVLHAHFTGGEPLLHPDLAALVARARGAGLYTSLVTSGVPLDETRLAGLVAAGLEHVQLSFQSADPVRADALAGRAVHAHKLEVARWVRALGLPLTCNVVLHRGNPDEIDALVGLAEHLGAHRLELANAQYLGHALVHRASLLPEPETLERARDRAALARARLAGRMEILFVFADHHRGVPRACMGGWGRGYLVVDPEGRVLPCHAAASIDGLRFERIGERPLPELWRTSPALVAYRGDAWMEAPCRGCERRELDFGGCRCQAFALTGRVGATDAACARSPAHHLVREAPRSGEPSARRRLVVVA